MSNQIKTEFETYVKNLAETISKEIYLEDLREICNAYTDQLEHCKTLMIENTKAQENAVESVISNLQKAEDIRETVEVQAGKINEMLQEYHDAYEKAGNSYLEEFHKEQNKDAEDFFERFHQLTRDARKELAEDIDNCNADLKKILHEVITPADLENYMEQMEKSTEKISAGLEILDRGYTDIFTQYTTQVRAYGDEERAYFRQVVKEYIDKVTEELETTSQRIMEQQQELIVEKIPDKQVLDDMGQRVADICTRMEQLQEEYAKKTDALLEEIEKNKEERNKRDKEWHTKNLILSGWSCFLSIIVLVMLQPWNSQIGLITMGVVAVFAIVYAFVVGRSNKR